jgi:hypothetical protein
MLLSQMTRISANTQFQMKGEWGKKKKRKEEEEEEEGISIDHLFPTVRKNNKLNIAKDKEVNKPLALCFTGML